VKKMVVVEEEKIGHEAGVHKVLPKLRIFAPVNGRGLGTTRKPAREWKVKEGHDSKMRAPLRGGPYHMFKDTAKKAKTTVRVYRKDHTRLPPGKGGERGYFGLWHRKEESLKSMRNWPQRL